MTTAELAPEATTTEDRGDDFTPTNEPEVLDGETGDASEAEPAQVARIPKARFDEVNEGRKAEKLRADAAEAELAALKAKAAPAPAPPPAAPAAEVTDLKNLRAQSRQAIAAGDMALAATLDDMIDTEVLRLAESRAAQSYAQTVQEMTLKTATSAALLEFPWLDTPEGADVVDMIIALRDKKMAAGIDAGTALLEATRHIAPRFAPDGETAPSRASTVMEGLKDTRSANALARGATDSNLQPPTTQAGIGNRTTATRVNVQTLTDEQFEKMDPAEKKRLRGD